MSGDDDQRPLRRRTYTPIAPQTTSRKSVTRTIARVALRRAGARPDRGGPESAGGSNVGPGPDAGGAETWGGAAACSGAGAWSAPGARGGPDGAGEGWLGNGPRILVVPGGGGGATLSWSRCGGADTTAGEACVFANGASSSFPKPSRGAGSG